MLLPWIDPEEDLHIVGVARGVERLHRFLDWEGARYQGANLDGLPGKGVDRLGKRPTTTASSAA